MDLDRIEAIESENKRLRDMVAELAVTQAETANALSRLAYMLERQASPTARQDAFFRMDLRREVDRAKEIGSSALALAQRAGVS
jgi:hypothetical protein